MLYKYEYLLHLFPKLSGYVDDLKSLKEMLDPQKISKATASYDNARNYLSKEEYSELGIDERNQRALDNYIKWQKSKWQIGRDYELFCGREYEKMDWAVEYIGMEQKLEDLGRDLIAHKNNEIHIVQCKYWSKRKIIHEKHIAQLFGTTIMYELENKVGLFYYNIIPVFITNTKLSDVAQRFAEKLKVVVVIRELKDFPRIKCNINGRDYIYHLPFDQQYDRTQIKNEGEFYAKTVKEATSKGFRRAFRHHY